MRDIRVEGIQRIEAGTVFSYLPVKVGETMTEEKAAAAIKALFATGFFKDVRLEVQRDVLIVMVEERPAVAQIDFIGNKEFDKDALNKGLREIGLAEGRVFRQGSARSGRAGNQAPVLVARTLRRQCGYHGYAARTQSRRHQFSINEGEVTKIQEINIIGNKAFKEKDLLDLFVLQTPGWLTWYTKNDQYSKQKLSGDLETLRSFYLDVAISSSTSTRPRSRSRRTSRTSTSPINITEGDKYTVSDVKLGGEVAGAGSRIAQA